jgi:hypothetical protein
MNTNMVKKFQMKGAKWSTFNTQAQAIRNEEGARREVEWHEEPLENTA